MATRDRDAVQLRAVVPLVVAATKELIGPAMIVANNAKAIAVAGSELLRPHNPKDLALAMSLDGSLLVPVANWGLGRYSGVGLVELGAAIPASTPDLTPLPINSVNASVDTRGAPSALVSISAREGGGYQRDLVPVYVDIVDNGGSGLADDLMRLASPMDATDVGRIVTGAILFSWFPSDPVLGRKPEVLAVGIAYPYTLNTLRPRELAAFAEILGLDDLGRALISKGEEPAERPELAQVTGEIDEIRRQPETKS